MIEFASVLVSRYLVGHDGKTGYERLKGKASKAIGKNAKNKSKAKL